MPASLQFIYRRWFQVFSSGVILFFGTQQVLKFTGNINFIPVIILLGACVVPAAFVVYFYGQERIVDKVKHMDVPFDTVVGCFIVGGVIGVTVSGFIEYETLLNIPLLNLFGISVIEEVAKLIFPIAVYIRGRYRSETDGLLFGVASGMGFAAIETMGYGMAAFIKSHGDMRTLEEVLLVRGLLSPVGHAAWTGLVCAALWRQREQSRKLFNPSIMGVFLLTVVLHTVWDIASSTNKTLIAFPSYAIIGGASLTLLVRRLKESKQLTLKKLSFFN
ncbi:MAG: forkhead-associated protein [Dehalococcoidia bacterium]|nr:forkhead-associated protein [Dehalococcoidia bacterium]